VGQWFFEIGFRSFALDLAKHLQGALRFADGEVGRVGRARRVGQWFHEFHLKCFAKAIFHRGMQSP
jgi:hypothetical protein